MEFSFSKKRENQFSEDRRRSKYKQFEVISCSTEIDLSRGSERILRENRNELIAYIKLNLIKYDLRSKYQEYEIFNEAYERAIKTIGKGKEIPNLYGWYKITILNVIREYSRIEQKQKNIKRMFSSTLQEKEVFDSSSEFQDGSMEKIKEIVKSEVDYRILFLRIVEENNWEEVCQILIQEGYFNCEVSKQFVVRIRQRFHRIIKKIPRRES